MESYHHLAPPEMELTYFVLLFSILEKICTLSTLAMVLFQEKNGMSSAFKGRELRVLIFICNGKGMKLTKGMGRQQSLYQSVAKQVTLVVIL